MKDQTDILKARIRYLEQIVSALGREAAYLSTQASLSDCRICDYAQWCDRDADQNEPDELMCQEAILRYCERPGVRGMNHAKDDLDALLQTYHDACTARDKEHLAFLACAIPGLVGLVRKLEAENATLEAELEVLREEKRLVFPALIESVANVDNSLSAFLDDSIKRAAHRSDR